LLQEVAGYETIGPVLLGLNKPVHILQLGSHVRSIYNMVLISVVDAQMKCKKQKSKNAESTSRWRKLKKAPAETK
jgi:malate dehydrogenase (oxaloacetate-decarboxylating)(NADP+)